MTIVANYRSSVPRQKRQYLAPEELFEGHNDPSRHRRQTKRLLPNHLGQPLKPKIDCVKYFCHPDVSVFANLVDGAAIGLMLENDVVQSTCDLGTCFMKG